MKILVAIDLSEATGKIVEHVRKFAKALSAEVWLLHVADPEPDFVGFNAGPQSTRDIRAANFHREHSEIQAIAESLRMEGLDATALQIQGLAEETILKEASGLDANMIVVGSHGRGAVYSLLVGSVSKGVLHKAECPVLVIPTHERTNE